MNKIIFTDLDGTLTLRDTYLKFLLHNVTPLIVLKNTPTLLLMLLQYFLHNIDGDDVKIITFKMVFRGYDSEKNIDDFIESIPWNPKVLEAIAKKKKDGYKVVIVTASPDIYVQHLCEYLQYDGFIATKTLKTSSLLQGTFDGKICNFEEKPKRIREYLGENEILEHTISYGNSTGDYAMLKFCDESYFVNKLDIKRFEEI